MSGTERIAALLCGPELSASDKNLLKILAFFGITPVKIGVHELNEEVIAWRVKGAEYCLFGSALNLASARKRRAIPASAKSAFLYDFQHTPECEALLRCLTGVPHLAIRKETASHTSISVSKLWPEFCGPMSGIKMGSVRIGGSGTAFSCSQERQYQSLMDAEDGDIFVKFSVEGVPVFAMSSDLEIDLDARVAGAYFDIKDYGAAVPIVTYLKWAFKDQLWTSPECNASLIIDDPLLKKRYGYLAFREVFELMRHNQFATTIAFIPWNWKRTDRKTAELFVEYPERYSLVVHGNDHTSGEFGASSRELLDGKIQAATKRMEAHHRRSGVEWSRIMVFPQGVFSVEAVAALKMNNFIAAVNTEVTPVGDEVPRAKLADLWNTAITTHSSFPVFTRRYIEHGIENFAFDILLGKPCLLVGHHEVFKDGAKQLLEFVSALNSLHCGLQWRSLGEAVKRSYRRRERGEQTEIEMFASQMFLENRGRHTKVFCVTKHESDAATVSEVTVNRQTIEWTGGAQTIQFRLELGVGESAIVEIKYAGECLTGATAEPLGYRVKCAARRVLSEFRDDYVCRSAFLTRCAATLRGCLKS